MSVDGPAQEGRSPTGGTCPSYADAGPSAPSLECSRLTSPATAGGTPARSSRDVPVLERPPTCFHFPRGMQRVWTCGRSSSFRLLERSATGGGLNVALTPLEAGSPRQKDGVLGKSNPPHTKTRAPGPPPRPRRCSVRARPAAGPVRRVPRMAGTHLCPDFPRARNRSRTQLGVS